MNSLLEIYQSDRPKCVDAFGKALGEIDEDCEAADDGPVTIEALAYAYAGGYLRTFYHLLDRAPEDVGQAALARIPEGEGGWEREIGAEWWASTAHAASSHGRPVYVGDCDQHGDAPHSLEEFCACGLARVRRARGVDTQEALATLLDVAQSTVSGWERGALRPGPRTRDALEEWLIGGER